VKGNPALCVLFSVLGINMEPKAFIFILPMMVYMMKAQIISSEINSRAGSPNFQMLFNEVSEKSLNIIGAYVIFFGLTGLIWLPWIISEDFGGLFEIVKTAYLPDVSSSTMVIRIFIFMFIFGYNMRAFLLQTTKMIFLLTLLNLSIGYSLCFTMNADSLSIIITCGLLSFYEIRSIVSLLITTCIYSIYPDVLRLQCQGLYFTSSLIYLCLVKLFMHNLEKMIIDNFSKEDGNVELVDANRDKNLDEKL
jgi:hypothetical protein